MKNWIGIAAMLGIVLIGAACAPVEHGAGHHSDADMSAEEAMEDLVHRWNEAMASGDVDTAAALYVSENPAIMPPDQPAQAGEEGVKAVLSEMFADGGLTVRNYKQRVVSGGDLVIAHGTYTWTKTDESGEPMDEKGKWTAVSRQNEDGSLVTLRNIWNRDAPLPGVEGPPPVEATGPPPAETAPCLDSPKALDNAFVMNFTEGNVPQLVAIHAEDGARMPPNMPPLMGQADVGAFLQSRVDQFSDRVLELMDVGEQIAEDLGYSWGNYHIAFTPKEGGEPVSENGKFVAVSRKQADGCWRYEWVQWNSDSPPPGS